MMNIQRNKNAILCYAVLRLHGDKIPKDKNEAIKYLKIASKREIAEASSLLTLISLGGVDSTDDDDDINTDESEEKNG